MFFCVKMVNNSACLAVFIFLKALKIFVNAQTQNVSPEFQMTQNVRGVETLLISTSSASDVFLKLHHFV